MATKSPTTRLPPSKIRPLSTIVKSTEAKKAPENHTIHSTLTTPNQKLSRESIYKVAKSSKKIIKVVSTRPTIEIYRPPVLRRDLHSTRSSEDLSTKPFSVAGSKQQQLRYINNQQRIDNFNNYYDFKRNSTECIPSVTGASKTNVSNQMQYKNRTFSHNKSADNLPPLNTLLKPKHNETLKKGVEAKQLRSATPSADLNLHQIAKLTSSPPPNNNTTNGQSAVTMKRSGSFVKDLPKKKTFGAKEAEEAKNLFEMLHLPDDELIKKWIDGNFECAQSAEPIGQVLVQMAIEHCKPIKTICKLCALLIDCSSGEQFHSGLLNSCAQYYDCRVKLKEYHFKFWLAFINCVSELYSSFGYLYEGKLVEILLQIYSYILQPSILEHIKIEELESLISSLLSVGYNLERQCPENLNEFLVRLRNSFIDAHEPWVRKMLLLMIELSASNWKLPSEANEYYFQTHQTDSAS